MNNVSNQSINEQLSALMDGELPRDETRFLMRRLDADTQLAKTWSNYQLAGDVLKKRFATPMRADFAASVMQIIEAERQPTASRSGLLRWAGGGAIAAAVAVFALTSTQRLDDVTPQQQPMVASTSSPVTTGVSTPAIEKQLSTGILPGRSPLDYTTAASYDQWLTPRQNQPVVYPPLMEARAPQVIYFYAPPEQPKQ
jgi:sigma-E factor negative regulatory protein RseA